ncbi:metal ABC transporter permease [Salaquimonas pukyongi]|uniref:metal ABC transporter permease n=1 Tax=Salaquimonas pukyongi TaxID=2712698 RepID=UPI00096BCF97|nr:metal ABC transporter permease [Salaquimonas pukyongi]
MDTMLLPFQFPFMQQAFLIAVAVSVPAGLLSCFLVLKGWALMGDAISHAVLPGIVLAYIAGLPLALGAFAAGLICAVSTGFIGDNSRLREDTVMGVVFSGMFALGLVMFTAISTDVHLDHILFGDLLGSTWADAVNVMAISGTVTLILVLKWRDLMLHVFDPQQSRATGQPLWLYHYGLLTLLSLTIVAALQAVGLILAIALLITPGAIAFMVTRTFPVMLLTAIAISASSAFAGVYVSFFIDSAPAPTIVLVMAAWFIVVFVAKSRAAAPGPADY